MAATVKYYKHTTTGSAVKLTTIIGGARDFVTDVAIRAAIGNTGIVYHGDSNVTAAGANAGGYVSARETFTISLAQARIDTDRIWFAGTNPDIIYITVIT